MQLLQGLPFEVDRDGRGFDSRLPDCRRTSTRGRHPHCPGRSHNTKRLSFKLHICIGNRSAAAASQSPIAIIPFL